MERAKRRYIFTFEGGGWNTVWAKSLPGAKKQAVLEYAYSDTLNVILWIITIQSSNCNAISLKSCIVGMATANRVA